MKTLHKKFKLTSIAFILISGLLLTPSCSKNDDNEPINYNTYYEHELLVSYPSSGIKTLFEGLSALYPELAVIVNDIKYNVDVYKVTYYTPFQGQTIKASGLVCIPNSDDGSFPIVSFQNGTNTAHANAPTVDYKGTLFTYLESAASMGLIILIPDYIGFGAAEQFNHPYLHKQSTTTSVLDLIEATREMYDANLISGAWNEDVMLMGYSQGGWATLSTHKYITELSDPGFNLVASSCGAGPYDLSIVQNYMFEGATYEQPVYMAYTGVSYHTLDLITNPLSDYFNEPYATNLPGYFDGSLTNGQINDKLNDTVYVLVTESFLTGINDNPKYEDFRNAMNSNSVFGWNTTQPIKLYHGTADTYVPPTTTEVVYQEFVDAGASDMVEYIPLPGKDHVGGAIPMVVGSLVWFHEIK